MKTPKAALLALMLFLLPVWSVKDGACGTQDKTPSPIAPSGQQSVSRYPEVMVIGSRLPTYQIPFADVPSNTSYIPANVSSKSGAEIHASHPETFQETVEELEGVVLYDSVGNGVDTTFSLRGFQESSAVSVLLDGVRINELDGNGLVFPLIDVSDLESIQVDRGSASHIYGSGAFAGVVHLTSGRPSTKPFSLFGGLEVSSFDGIRFHDGVSGTLPDKITGVGGKWTYYFKGGRNLSEGFRENGEYRITNFDAKTSYELPDNEGRIYFGAKHVDNAISNPGELTLEQYNQDPSRTNKPLDGRKYKTTILHGGVDKTFWDEKLTASIFNSWRINEVNFFGTTATFADFVTGSNPDTDFTSVDSRQTDLVWQLAYRDFFGPVENRTYLGMEFRDGSEFAKEQDAFGGRVAPGALVETERDSDSYNTALFWRESLEFYERVVLHAGMRHDFHWLRSSNHITPEDSIDRRWRDSTFSTGIIVRPIKPVDLFANYSQGFRVPTISEIAPFSGTISTNLDPETSDSYEVGTRVRYKELALFKLSYFLIDLQNEIVFDSAAIGAAAPFGQNLNVGESRRSGIETRFDLKPIPEAELFGSYTFTEAYIRETTAGASVVDGRALGQIPMHRASVGAMLYPLRSLGETYAGFRFGMAGTYTGQQQTQSFESAGQALLDSTGSAGHVIKSYTLWNFLIAYAWREKEIYFKINNLFDNQYYSRAVAATSFGSAIYPAGDYVFVNPGAPREYVGGVRYEF